MKLLLRVLVLMLSLATTLGQFRYGFEKPGSCPPPLPIQICSQSCFFDAQCSDIGKCCPTNCGGFTCTRLVTKVEAVPREKPGSCPPPLPVQICSQSCFSDAQCSDIGKCCPTNCGGFTCTRPVTKVEAVPREKPGSCPAEPKGRWVCSSTCGVDNHCRGTLKCCKNRCGAFACQKPDVEVIESLDIPLVPVEDDSYNNPSNPYSNPYSNPRDPNNYAYHSYN